MCHITKESYGEAYLHRVVREKLWGVAFKIRHNGERGANCGKNREEGIPGRGKGMHKGLWMRKILVSLTHRKVASVAETQWPKDKIAGEEVREGGWQGPHRARLCEL